ncbi:MAG: HK97 family phage prohead protease [Magnetococcus sp. WYHC-3]
MPIPKPKSKESKDEFVGRCMSAIGGEYDDKDQALAICFDAWKNKEKKGDEMKIERRCIPVTELRTLKEEGQPAKIIGYAAVFNSLSEDLGGFREKIDPGAFHDAIGRSDTRMLWNHDSNYVLGRKSAGTLSLKEDDKGLKIENTPPDTQWARDLMVSIDRGDINQMSFGFRIEEDKWEEKEGKETIRTLVRIADLPDVSPVTYPAYVNTEVALRSMEEWRNQDKKEGTAAADATAKEDESVPMNETNLQRQRELNLKKKLMED